MTVPYSGTTFYQLQSYGSGSVATIANSAQNMKAILAKECCACCSW
jgi:hypothetical protein